MTSETGPNPSQEGQRKPVIIATPDLSNEDLQKALRSAIGSEAQVVLIREQLVTSSFSGPLPHPDILAGFEKVIPGGAARILKMAEKQSEHRMFCERTVIVGDSRRAWAGIAAGFTLGLAGIIGGVVLGIYGQTGFGYALSGASIVSLVGVFVYGTRSRREERHTKAQAVKKGEPPAEGTSAASAPKM